MKTNVFFINYFPIQWKKFWKFYVCIIEKYGKAKCTLVIVHENVTETFPIQGKNIPFSKKISLNFSNYLPISKDQSENLQSSNGMENEENFNK